MQIAGLVDDDFGMELLVDGRIISLSLPVRLVYECVWRPALAEHARGGRSAAVTAQPPASNRGDEVIGPPMVITYRLQVGWGSRHAVVVALRHWV